MIIQESSNSCMGRDWCKTGDHGKVHSERQHKKRKASGRWKYCHMRGKRKLKLRWNKKKGVQEWSTKNSKEWELIWCN